MGVLEVKPKLLKHMAGVTEDGANGLAKARGHFLGSSVAPRGTFGSSPAGQELWAATATAADAGNGAAAALVSQLHRDVDGLHRNAKHYEDVEANNAGLVGRVRHAIADIF